MHLAPDSTFEQFKEEDITENPVVIKITDKINNLIA